LTSIINNTQVILLAAGSSSRFSSKKNKVLTYYKDKTLLEHNIYHLKKIGFKKITLAIGSIKIPKLDIFKDIEVLKGGKTRSKSVNNALVNTKFNKKYVIVHDAARPILDNSIFFKIIDLLKKNKFDAIIPYSKCTETLILNRNNINRDKIKIIKTPQAFNRKKLIKLHQLNLDKNITDDSYLFRKEKKYKIKYVLEKKPNIKITYKEELDFINNLVETKFRVGLGYDIHRIKQSNKINTIILGATHIKSKIEIISHSDGDVILHAITDSILGAISKRDIGTYFPNNKINKKRNSIDFLNFALQKMIDNNFKINNVDLMIVSEYPKINPYYNKIKIRLVKILKTDNITIKATTNEKSGLIGEGKFIACWSNISLIGD
jgi:2-C-methyl-D-erythritol 4-phosphate cytidylyltransferase/2-C-methyl-D-erythritol 2,4-cyclodiphosphate synthase